MRNVLPAAVTAIGIVGLAGAAQAQTAAPAPAPVVNTGIPSWIYAPFTSPPGPTPLPGEMKAYFRGRMHFDVGLASDSGTNYNGGKRSPVMMGEYMRFYSGFDGVLANGMKYGGFIEVRQNGSSGNPSAVYPGPVNASGQTGNNSLIFRTAHGYIGGSWGQFRFGQTYDAIQTMLTGAFENFDDSAWNSSELPVWFSSTTEVAWPFSDVSGVYGVTKVLYLSPRIYGVDGAISWQPYTISSGEPQCTNATQNCPNLIAAGVNNAANQLQRNVNLVDGVVRYTGSFGQFGVVGTIGGAVSGVVSNNGILPTAPTGTAGANNGTVVNYKDVGAFDSGLILTYGGLAVGGHVFTGSMNGNNSNAFLPVGKGYPNQTSWLAGVSYAWGPFIVGASYLVNTFAGALGGQYAPTVAGGTATHFGLRREEGIAVGSTFAYAPGALMFVSFLYGHRHQAGYNFLADTRSTSFNNTSARGALIGNTFNW